MLHNRLGESYLGCTCRSRVPVSYKNCLLEKKNDVLSLSRAICQKRLEGSGGGGGSRSGPGHIGLLYVIYPNFQEFLFDFLKRFQETEPFHFRSSSIIDYLETFWQFIPGD